LSEFCEKLAKAIEHAPNEEVRALLLDLADKFCGVSTQDDTGGNGPPPQE